MFPQHLLHFRSRVERIILTWGIFCTIVALLTQWISEVWVFNHFRGGIRHHKIWMQEFILLFQSSHNSWKFALFSVAQEHEIMIGVPLRSESIKHRLGKNPFLHWIFCRLFCPYFRRPWHHNLLIAYRNMLYTEAIHALLQKRVWTLSMPTVLCPWVK